MLYARRFLRDAAASGLSDAGGPMVPTPPSFGFRLCYRVQVTTTSDNDLADKALPDEVLEQLLAESALAVLRRLSGEQMVAWVRLLHKRNQGIRTTSKLCGPFHYACSSR